MATYAQRFTQALSDALPESFTVEDSQGLIVATHKDEGRLIYWLPRADKRKPVSAQDVSEWIDTATSRARGEMPKLKPEFQAKSRAMLAELTTIEGN